ncbi:hypothetical protein DIX45_04445, partial [Streptococcus iniae]
MIHSNYEQYLKQFEDADPFATISYRVLRGDFPFTVNEVAARILKYEKATLFCTTFIKCFSRQ